MANGNESRSDKIKKFKGMETIAARYGEYIDSKIGNVITPIFQTSTYFFPTEDPLTWEGEVPDGTYIYLRYGNPTERAVTDKLARMEGAEKGLLFSSGMAAISTTLLTYLSKGDHIVSVEDVYGGSFNLMRNSFPRMGIEVSLVDSTDTQQIVDSISDVTKIVYLESPTNPLLKITDVPEVVKVAHEAGAKVVMDNTFATPVNQNPIEMGVDLVIHSCTKFLNGHSDVLAGAVVGSSNDMEAIWDQRIVFGGSPDPVAAFLLLRGMRTLVLRMKKHSENGMAMAEFLEDHPRVDGVYYPGLESNPQHSLAKKMLRDFGGMVSFNVKGSRQDAEHVLRSFELFAMATSLGGVESLASMPLNSSHHALSPEDRAKMGIKDQLIRLSVGIEDIEDLKEDMDNALNSF
ncbi:MAG: aminotransferase class I/II-fold pyridoxal phosphate-dependent enzyme [Methanomassiliicoccales archaeon]|nr:aminotransferase class I/II-fold pyridoxal phosphate-dependent enzyme [Methanomassiliicoccales archaeon]